MFASDQNPTFNDNGRLVEPGRRAAAEQDSDVRLRLLAAHPDQPCGLGCGHHYAQPRC
ncbi:MAG: hypothetical protein ACRD0K_12200 [Egibacteraceae bacterium]